MKRLSIFLSFVFLLTMLPVTVTFSDYQKARDTISFSTIKGENTDQFFLDKNLALPDVVRDPDNNIDHRVEWVSSDGNALSISPEAVGGYYTGSIHRGSADVWVTITAKVYHEENPNEAVTRNIPVRVPAADDSVNYLLRENFEDKTISGSEVASDITSTTVSTDDWYMSGTGNLTDYKYMEYSEGMTGKILKMTGKTSISNVFAVHKLEGTLPSKGLVSYSLNFMIPVGSQSPQMILRPFSRQMSLSTISKYDTTAGTVPYSFLPSRWYHMMTIYDIDKKVASVYINGVKQFDETVDPMPSYLVWDEIRIRMVNSNGQSVYLDNIEVKAILQEEQEAMAAFNPATKGSIYVDGNLPNTIEGIDGGTLTYESSDETVIASDGRATLPDFFRTVTVTPQVKMGHIVLKGKTRSLTVLPKNYKERLFEDFSNVEEGDFFYSDGTTKNSGWSQNRTVADYQTAQNDGTRTSVLAEDGNYVLKMSCTANTKNYSLTKAIENPDCGDRVAFLARIKNVGAGTINLANPYIGILRPNYQSWRGHYAASSAYGDDVTNTAFSLKNTWQTFLFVYDKGVTKVINDVDCHPISLYVDGTFIGTAYSPKDSPSLNEESFILLQNTSYGASDIYIDDILLMNFDAQELQFTNTTYENNVVTSVGMQYNSYGTENEMTMIAASYQNGVLTKLLSLEQLTELNTGNNNIDVNYSLPSGTTSYRLFLFSGIENLRPLAISKEYMIQ